MPGPGAGGFGCYGFSSLGHGLVGATGTAGGSAVVGATNGVAGAFAGVFFGPLLVVGGPKSAAAPHPDGGHRLLYCVESPESWFEDFGNARLVRGAADIKIDPDFVTVADTSSYNVFLTPYGDSTGLFVAERTPNGFVVEEHNCGTSEIEFAWRVVAKRKDITGERFAKVTLPAEPPPPPVATEPVEGKTVPAPPTKRVRPHKH